ncbi:LysR family transcriptional regulator [Ammoniphilus sp. YIM 78166]|uniref:LysR family transcriptional regulator n=1 Tax=Ammoniphilus sp. YIM 78166 TaxID=1644106 RepID=UPI00106F982B|nr:LysR family transcriptional regulator [Ammoniphilus sp. YIM 78166]
MDIEQLQAFVVLAHNKSFSKTAESLHLVQSTVTARIQSLERSVGRPLFTRNNRKVEITPAGLSLLPYAERILMLRQESLQKLKAMETYSERLAIGSLDSIWKYMLSPVLKDFYVQYPHVALSTKTGHSADMIQYLMDGVIQVGFVFLQPHLPGYEVTPFYEDEIILVAHPDHPAVELGGVYPEQLSELSFIYINWGSPFQEWMEEILSPNYLPRIQVDQASLALSLVSEQLGISLVTKSCAEHRVRARELVEIPLLGSKKPPKRTAYAVVHREKRESPAVESWFSHMKSYGFFNQDIVTKGE